jgi:hypothetical protein
MMEINRNQYFFAGLVILASGFQFRMVDRFVLTPELTQYLAKQTGNPVATVNYATQTLFQNEKAAFTKEVRPPDWIGWALMSIGSVLILHALAMQKPPSG